MAAVLAVALGAGSASPAMSETPAAKVDVGELLFDGRHFGSAAADAVIRYAYERSSRDPERTKPSFTDTVELRLQPAETPDRRNIIVTLFKGPMHRAAGPFDGVAYNPIVILMLEYHLGDFAKILGGNPRYFKNAIRAGMRDAATAEAVTVTLAGKPVAATRITVSPYVEDPNRARFGVFAGTRYQFTVAEAVPGSIVEIRITTPDPAGGPAILEEVTRHVED